MALFDIFKKTKKEKTEAKGTSKKKAPKETPKREEKQSLDEVLRPQSQKPVGGGIKKIEKKQFPEAFGILESPHVTEKSGRLAEKNSYVFKVNRDSNKQEIKKAVQDLYGVVVEAVNIVNIPKKHRRIGKSEGYKPGYKKAMVKLAEGEKIEIMPR